MKKKRYPKKIQAMLDAEPLNEFWLTPWPRSREYQEYYDLIFKNPKFVKMEGGK